MKVKTRIIVLAFLSISLSFVLCKNAKDSQTQTQKKSTVRDKAPRKDSKSTGKGFTSIDETNGKSRTVTKTADAVDGSQDNINATSMV